MTQIAMRVMGSVLVALLLVAAIAAGLLQIYKTGYMTGYQVADSKGLASLEALRKEQAMQALKAAQAAEADAKDAAKKLHDEQVRIDQLAAELAAQQRQNRTTTDRLSGEIARVNDLYRKARDSAPEPLPACVFTHGWVRVYDEATGARLPEATDPDRTAAPSADAAATEQLDSGINQREVLAHHIHYSEQCRNTSAQLNALIDALEGQ